MLQGYKTYIIGLVMIAYAAVMVWNHAMDLTSAADIIGGALAVMGLRGGISTEIRLVLAAMGVPLPADPTSARIGQVKAAVAAFKPAMRRAAPMLIVCLVMGAGLLAACAPGSFFDNPSNDLQIAEDGFAAAQVLYNSVCAANSGASFCSAANMKMANDAADAARNAIASAEAVVANSNSTSAQIAAAIMGAQNAIRDFTKVVNDLQTAKAKAMAAKAALTVSFFYRVEHSPAMLWMLRHI